MSAPRDDLVYVEDMLARAQRALRKTDDVTWAEYEADEDLHDIVERCISVIGEAACKVSDEFRLRHPEIPWAEAAGMRHKIIHNYFEVNHVIVWSVVREELPPLERALVALLAEEDQGYPEP